VLGVVGDVHGVRAGYAAAVVPQQPTVVIAPEPATVPVAVPKPEKESQRQCQ
jgi:hypothetical protein